MRWMRIEGFVVLSTMLWDVDLDQTDADAFSKHEGEASVLSVLCQFFFCMCTYWAFRCHVRLKSYRYTWQEGGLTKLSLLNAVSSRHQVEHGNMARHACRSLPYPRGPAATMLTPQWLHYDPEWALTRFFLCFSTGLHKLTVDVGVWCSHFWSLCKASDIDPEEKVVLRQLRLCMFAPPHHHH